MLIRHVSLTTDIFVIAGLFVLLAPMATADTNVTVDIIQNVVKIPTNVQNPQNVVIVDTDLILIFANVERIETTARTRVSGIAVGIVLALTIEVAVKFLTDLLDDFFDTIIKGRVSVKVAVFVLNPLTNTIVPIVTTLIDDVTVTVGVIGILGAILLGPLTALIQEILYNLYFPFPPVLFGTMCAALTIVKRVTMPTLGIIGTKDNIVIVRRNRLKRTIDHCLHFRHNCTPVCGGGGGQLHKHTVLFGKVK
jgi:hypothetical protein